MTMPMFTVLLSKKPSADAIEKAVASLVENLGIKAKTAQQIIDNIPLRVYNHLSLVEGRILVEALNVVTTLDWEVQSEVDATIPSVNWNKTPTVCGLSLVELVAKNDPVKTGVAKIIPALNLALPEAPKSVGPSVVEKKEELENSPVGLQKETTLGDDVESTILRTADSVVRHLSMDLAEAYLKKNSPLNPSETQSKAAFANDSQNIPGTMKSKLAPGFYNLYLPAITNKDLRQKVSKMCQDSLNWTPAETMQNLSKPIICLARNIDDIDASRLMDQFAQINVTLNCKLRSKI